MERLVLATTVLSFSGSLEGEMQRHLEYQNRESIFQLARLEDDIKHLNKRIEMARKEKALGPAGNYVAQYIKELEGEIEKLQRQKKEMDAQKVGLQLTPEQSQLLRERLRDFAQRIKIEPPDVQHRLLTDFITSVMADQLSGGFKMTYNIKLPTDTNMNQVIVLEKTLYFNLN